MFGNLPRPALTAAVGLLSATVLAIGAPTVQAAPQVPALPAAPELPRANPGGTSVLPIQVPFDNELAAALHFVKQLGGDKVLVEVLQAIIGAAGQISPLTAADQVPTPGIKKVDAAADPLSLLRQAGVHPLSPSVAPLCTAPTPDNPLGLATAGAAGIPGPWPLRTANPVSTLPFPLPGVNVPDPNVVKDKHTAFAFIPADAGVAGISGAGDDDLDDRSAHHRQAFATAVQAWIVGEAHHRARSAHPAQVEDDAVEAGMFTEPDPGGRQSRTF